MQARAYSRGGKAAPGGLPRSQASGPEESVLLSAEKLAEFQAELERLTQEERPRILPRPLRSQSGRRPARKRGL